MSLNARINARMCDFLSQSPHLCDDVQVTCHGHVEAVTRCSNKVHIQQEF